MSFDNILPIDRKKGKHDADLKAFHSMVQKLRGLLFVVPKTHLLIVFFFFYELR